VKKMMKLSGDKGKTPCHMSWYKGSYDKECPYLGYMNVGGSNHST